MLMSAPVLAVELEEQGLTGFLCSPQNRVPMQSMGTLGELSSASQILSPTCVLL